MIVKSLDLQAEAASEYLKCFAHPVRLRILCALAGGESSVGHLSRTAGAPMATISRHLAQLRAEDVVELRRDGQTIYYRLANDRAGRLIEALAGLFCPIVPQKLTEGETK